MRRKRRKHETKRRLRLRPTLMESLPLPEQRLRQEVIRFTGCFSLVWCGEKNWLKFNFLLFIVHQPLKLLQEEESSDCNAKPTVCFRGNAANRKQQATGAVYTSQRLMGAVVQTETASLTTWGETFGACHSWDGEFISPLNANAILGCWLNSRCSSAFRREDLFQPLFTSWARGRGKEQNPPFNTLSHSLTALNEVKRCPELRLKAEQRPKAAWRFYMSVYTCVCVFI